MRLRIVNAIVVTALGLSAATRPAFAVLEGYPSDNSLAPGDTLKLHVRTSAATYRVSIWRMAQAPEHVAEAGTYPGHNYVVPASSWEVGCGWPVTCRIPVPGNWRPGAYLARLDAGTGMSWLPFIVRARVPGSTARIAVQLSLNTYQAYNRYGGKSLYGAWLPGLTGRSYRVSFDRPYNFFSTDGSGQFFLWEAPFIAFLEREGIAYEVIANYDLHRFPGILDSYRLFCSVGHDEYWSKEMYDEVERFANAGGNLAFFSGNCIWWQVRFEAGGRTMVCYKDASLDPLNGVQNELVTVNWQSPPVNRPPARLVGTHYNGSWGVPPGAYHVVNRQHWAYSGVAVDSAQSFGYPMVGYEIDARNRFSPPVDVIARVDLPDPNNGGVLRAAEMTYYERTAAYGFQGGSGAKIFAGSSVNYVQGIDAGYNPATNTVGAIDPVARTVTLNVFDRMACEVAPPQLAAPAEGTAVRGPRILLEWYPAATHRRGVEVQYMMYWREQNAATESLATAQTSAWLPVKDGDAYKWWVRASTACGAEQVSTVADFVVTRPTDSIATARPPGLAARLDGDHVVFHLTLATATTVRLDILTARGTCVRSFGSARYPDGSTEVIWDRRNSQGKPTAAGLYFVRARFDNRVLRTKVLLLH
jgi:hypothetical protein